MTQPFPRRNRSLHPLRARDGAAETTERQAMDLVAEVVSDPALEPGADPASVPGPVEDPR